MSRSGISSASTHCRRPAPRPADLKELLPTSWGCRGVATKAAAIRWSSPLGEVTERCAERIVLREAHDSEFLVCVLRSQPLDIEVSFLILLLPAMRGARGDP